MRLSVLLASAVIALGGSALASAAAAATVTLDETLDLSTPQDNGGNTAGWRGFGSFSPAFEFDLNAGDTLDYTIRFAPGQSLTLINPTFFWAFSYVAGSTPSNVNGTGSLALLDAGGGVLYSTGEKTDDEGEAHFGQQFFDGDFGGLPSSITFAGLHYVGTVNSYANPDVTTRTYNDPQLLFGAGGATLNGVVPEPASWALMVAGFGLAGGMLRRRAVAA